jgi:hypothetical protein
VPRLSTGDWGDITVLRGPGNVVFPCLYSWLRICVAELFFLSLCVEALCCFEIWSLLVVLDDKVSVRLKRKHVTNFTDESTFREGDSNSVGQGLESFLDLGCRCVPEIIAWMKRDVSIRKLRLCAQVKPTHMYACKMFCLICVILKIIYFRRYIATTACL